MNNSNTREEMAYWEWFLGYLQITSRKDLEGGFIHTGKAISLTKDSGEFLCQILALRAKYNNYSMQYGKELATLDRINDTSERINGKPAFWACIRKAKLLQRLKKNR